MGADLEIQQDGKQIAYFRDSYNSSNILWQFGGRYWDMLKLKSQKAKIEYLKDCLKKLPYKKNEWEDMLNDKWKAYFMEKADKFEEWIRTADRMRTQKGVKIIWSC